VTSRKSLSKSKKRFNRSSSRLKRRMPSQTSLVANIPRTSSSSKPHKSILKLLCKNKNLPTESPFKIQLPSSDDSPSLKTTLRRRTSRAHLASNRSLTSFKCKSRSEQTSVSRRKYRYRKMRRLAVHKSYGLPSLMTMSIRFLLDLSSLTNYTGKSTSLNLNLNLRAGR
jgi:hypothetical protein